MNVPVESVKAIILGHCHLDHVGDLRTFPPSVDLVVGPDTVDLDELADEMDVPKETLKERKVRYMNRKKDRWRDVGTFKGHDYFGDGSLFILDAPGVSHYHVRYVTLMLESECFSTSRAISASWYVRQAHRLFIISLRRMWRMKFPS